MIWYVKLFYRYFPFVAFFCCLAGELFFGVVITLTVLRGWFIFILWPSALLFWLIFWIIKKPEMTQNTYYLFVALVFCTFVLAILTPHICNLLAIPETSKQIIIQNLGRTLCVMYVVLAVYQLWARKHWQKQRRPSEWTLGRKTSKNNK